MTRADAIMALLELPDEPTCRRGHRVTQPGWHGRHQIVPVLTQAWIAWRLETMPRTPLTTKPSAQPRPAQVLPFYAQETGRLGGMRKKP